MRITELQHQVETSGYHVDPRAVAEALLRRVDPRRDPVLPGPFSPRRDGSPQAPPDVRPLPGR